MATTTAPSPEMIPLHLEQTAGAPPRRPRLHLIGSVFAAAASSAVVLGALAVYLQMRSTTIAETGEWFPTGTTIPLSAGNMSLTTLAMSLVLVQWAVWSGRRGDRPHTYMAVGLTIVLGVAHITQIGYLWTQWELPLNGEPSVQAVLAFGVLGLHVAMVVAGLIYLALMGLRSLGGQFTGRDAEGLSAAALYWYVTVAVFAVIWYSILILK